MNSPFNNLEYTVGAHDYQHRIAAFFYFKFTFLELCMQESISIIDVNCEFK